MQRSLADKALDWQSLQPRLEFSQISTSIDFWHLQPHLTHSLRLFLNSPQSSLLLLKTDDNSAYLPLLTQWIEAQSDNSNNSIVGADYLITAGRQSDFPRISVKPAMSLQDNFAARTGNVQSALYVDQFKLFGSLRYHSASQQIQLTPGLVHRANGGVLILTLSALLTQFELWPRLKQILHSKTFDWYSAHPFKPLPCEVPGYPIDLKLILLGTRDELAAFADLEENLYRFADYTEIESYFMLNTTDEQQKWGNYISRLAQNNALTIDHKGINRLYQLLTRESGDRLTISVSPAKIIGLLKQAQALTHKAQLSAVDFDAVFEQQQRQYRFLREQAYADILNEQVYVATEGEFVGQINGLSVIEYPGTPISFGEPSRISCIVQFGDGEVIDVERKNELAGNLHSKGMMIAEACLAGILELPSQLPFSASLVFEQSYGDIDGDSASLAGFCVLTSALADLPLPQHIAVTGAIDQFGLVHAVGGVNDKIEGFFTICQRRELNGRQGVIIPSTTIQQLSLSHDVVSAVKNGQFFIYAVDDVYQACEILFQRDLIEEENKTYSKNNEPIAHLIQRRIDYRSEGNSRGFWANLFKS